MLVFDDTKFLAEINDFFMEIFDLFGLNKIHNKEDDYGNGKEEGGRVSDAKKIGKPI